MHISTENQPFSYLGDAGQAALLGQVRAGIMFVGPDLKIQWVNDAFCEIFKIPVPAAKISGLEWKMAIEYSRRLFSNESDFVARATEMILRSEKECGVEVKLSDGRVLLRDFIPIFEKGERAGTLWHYQDITAIKELAEERAKTATAEAVALNEKERNGKLHQVNEELDRLMHILSHDLKAPLNALSGILELIRANLSTPELIPELLGLMERSIQRMDQFIREILDYGQNARLELFTTEIPILELIFQSWESLIPGAKHVIHLEVEASGNPKISTDKLRFQNIINNLLSNAIRHSDPQKERSVVKVRIACDNPIFRLEFEDNGVGISEENLPKIFDLYFKGTGLGTGIGLYLVKESLAKLGGEIDVRSELGKGATFLIQLPCNMAST